MNIDAQLSSSERICATPLLLRSLLSRQIKEIVIMKGFQQCVTSTIHLVRVVGQMLQFDSCCSYLTLLAPDCTCLLIRTAKNVSDLQTGRTSSLLSETHMSKSSWSNHPRKTKDFKETFKKKIGSFFTGTQERSNIKDTRLMTRSKLEEEEPPLSMVGKQEYGCCEHYTYHRANSSGLWWTSHTT